MTASIAELRSCHLYSIHNIGWTYVRLVSTWGQDCCLTTIFRSGFWCLAFQPYLLLEAASTIVNRNENKRAKGRSIRCLLAFRQKSITFRDCFPEQKARTWGMFRALNWLLSVLRTLDQNAELFRALIVLWHCRSTFLLRCKLWTIRQKAVDKPTFCTHTFLFLFAMINYSGCGVDWGVVRRASLLRAWTAYFWKSLFVLRKIVSSKPSLDPYSLLSIPTIRERVKNDPVSQCTTNGKRKRRWFPFIFFRADVSRRSCRNIWQREDDDIFWSW